MSDGGVIIKGEDGSYYKLSKRQLEHYKLEGAAADDVHAKVEAKRSGKGEDFCVFAAAEHTMLDLGWAKKQRSED